MRFFQRGETADSKFTFLDDSTNEPIDVNDPKYKISHFDGPTEIVDVAETAMTKVASSTGEYIVNWTIPNTIPENETYFVTATGIHPTTNAKTVIEDFFRVLPANFFSGGGGTGLVAKFTKP